MKKALYLVGATIVVLMWLAALVGLLLAYSTTPPLSVHPPVLVIMFALAVAVGVAVHEIGHLVACLAVGAQIKSFRLGQEDGAIRFRVRNVQVSLHWPSHGGSSIGAPPRSAGGW